MRTLEEAIEYAEEVAKANESLVSNYENDKIRAKIHRQLAAYLRELQERRKADSCEGCKNIGLWENEYENGVSCPCLRCARRAKDNYEPERRSNG